MCASSHLVLIRHSETLVALVSRSCRYLQLSLMCFTEICGNGRLNYLKSEGHRLMNTMTTDQLVLSSDNPFDSNIIIVIEALLSLRDETQCLRP